MGFIASGSGIVYMALGIASLVIYSQNADATCSFESFLPLPQYLLGTGIAYLVIGVCLSLFGILALTLVFVVPLIAVILCSGAFTFAWMIVGAVTLWRPQDHGYDCATIAYSVWSMAMANVIITIVLVACACCSGVETKNSNN